MSKIRTLFIVIQFSITVGFVIAGMYLFKKSIHKIIKTWMRFQIKFLGITLEEVGTLDPSCDMVILNHQSLLDIIVIEHIHSRHLAWVGKKEISDLIFFGHIMKAPEMITIDRQNKTGLIKLIKEARDRVSKGRPIAMFPEGTRSSGDKMLSFKPGAAMVANKLKLKVQPIVVINTRNILDSQNLESHPGIVKVIYLEPVQADKATDWFKQTKEKMQAILTEESKKA